LYMCTFVYRPLPLSPYIHDACMHTHIHTHVHSYIHRYIHSYIHTYMHTYIHTYIHLNICMYVHLPLLRHSSYCASVYVYVYVYVLCVYVLCVYVLRVYVLRVYVLLKKTRAHMRSTHMRSLSRRLRQRRARTTRSPGCGWRPGGRRGPMLGSVGLVRLSRLQLCAVASPSVPLSPSPQLSSRSRALSPRHVPSPSAPLCIYIVYSLSVACAVACAVARALA